MENNIIVNATKSMTNSKYIQKTKDHINNLRDILFYKYKRIINFNNILLHFYEWHTQRFRRLGEHYKFGPKTIK